MQRTVAVGGRHTCVAMKMWHLRCKTNVCVCMATRQHETALSFLFYTTLVWPMHATLITKEYIYRLSHKSSDLIFRHVSKKKEKKWDEAQACAWFIGWFTASQFVSDYTPSLLIEMAHNLIAVRSKKICFRLLEWNTPTCQVATRGRVYPSMVGCDKHMYL